MAGRRKTSKEEKARKLKLLMEARALERKRREALGEIPKKKPRNQSDNLFFCIWCTRAFSGKDGHFVEYNKRYICPVCYKLYQLKEKNNGNESKATSEEQERADIGEEGEEDTERQT